jgi:Mg-chelatase subunit ChlD
VSEILEDLQRLSGKAIGADAARWSEWWDGVRNGRIALPTDIAAAGGQLSSATFFGLHAATDRVVFVVDRSTSMETTLGTGRRTRYEEAIEQLVHFLTSAGPETRFSLALFSQEGRTWRERLAPATALNVEQAKSWMAARGPAGGTRLFEGLRAGLELDRDGHLELERCEADTVIVLCDGATNEGPKWVARWLAAENEAAQLVFHCIQIGSGGDGTLEALAQGSGGQFLRVQE